MSDTKTIYTYKGYNYNSIIPYKIGDKCVGWKENVEIRNPIYRVLAGRDEHCTPLIMYQNYKNDWYLDVETVEGDATAEIFFASRNFTKEEIKVEVLSILQKGFTVVEGNRGILSVRY